MTLSTLIAQLTALQEIHGPEIEVQAITDEDAPDYKWTTHLAPIYFKSENVILIS